MSEIRYVLIPLADGEPLQPGTYEAEVTKIVPDPEDDNSLTIYVEVRK
jgi:hypothetical protein